VKTLCGLAIRNHHGMAGCGLQEQHWISFVWLGSDSNALAGEVDGCCAAGE